MICVEQIQACSSGQHTVTFSNGEAFTFSAEELCAFHICVQKEYSEEQFASLIDKVLCERAKGKIMRFVTFSRKTGGQVFEKIIGLGFPEHIAQQLVQELTEKGYLDDREYCCSYLKAAAAKGYSRSRIQMELRHKGVDETVLREILAEFPADDISSARKVLNKKLRTGGERDYNKLYAFLMRKGFSGETVRKVLQETERE